MFLERESELAGLKRTEIPEPMRPGKRLIQKGDE